MTHQLINQLPIEAKPFGEFEMAAQKVANQMIAGELDEISRWNVLGRVNEIIRLIKKAKKYHSWMRDHLDNLEELAKESL